MRLTILIRQLNDGGAQRQLVTLLRGIDKTRCETTVMTFYGGGIFHDEVAAIQGVRCVDLGKRGRWDAVPFVIRLIRELRSTRPDVLYSFLGVSNILSAVTRPFPSRTRLVWSIRASNMDLTRYSLLDRLVYRTECMLSRFAALVISNSESGKRHAAANGFPKERIIVIPNGIDCDRFSPDSEARRALRAELSIRDDEFLIGMVGRIDPMKDYSTFLRSAAEVAKKHKRARFICVGVGHEDHERKIQSLSESLGLSEKLIWAGRRTDMPALYNALDLLVSSSAFGEGFPNVVAEAMACGIPAIVTDVGDSRYIVADAGIVVPPANPAALAEAILRVATGKSAFAAQAVRSRIADNFAMKIMVSRTEDELCSLLSTH